MNAIPLISTIITGRHADRLEHRAAAELQRYYYQMTGRLPEVQTASGKIAPGNALVLGSWRSLPPIEDSGLWEQLKRHKTELGEEGFILQPYGDGFLIVGGSPVGTVYGVYDWLESAGVRFHLGGDYVPDADAARLPASTVVRQPVFKIRGSLPWFNFFNSPTTWNPQDYRHFFDQMLKLKNNFVGFHVYDGEPFAAYEEDGVYKQGAPLLTTAHATWGTVPIKTEQFGFGTGDYYDADVFGSDAALSGKSRDERIREQQRLLAEALEYARSIGIKVCLGFEVSGDLTKEEEQERFAKRLQHVVQAYPSLDYIWLWEPECWCGTYMQEHHYHSLGFALQPERSRFAAALREYGYAFEYLDDPKKVLEGVRMTLYGRYAHRLLRAASPHVKLVLSGWGGDKWLQFSDLYEGLNRTLPPDVILTALDNMIPTAADTISEGYANAPGRELWAIPWFEYDGDQWCPQPFTQQFQHLLKDAVDKGCAGFLGIHWRTRAVEEAAMYAARFAWNTELTVESFYRDYALGAYGDKLSRPMAAIHLRLHGLGYRWAGGRGQSECANFRWVKSPEADKLEALRQISLEVERCMAQAREQQLWTAEENLRYLYYNIQWVLRYEQAAAAFNVLGEPGPALKLLLEAEQAMESGDREQARSLAVEADRAFRRSGLREAMQAYARTVSNRGELGVLATINSKAYADYLEKRGRLQVLAEQLGLELPPDGQGGRTESDAVAEAAGGAVLQPLGRQATIVPGERFDVYVDAGDGASEPAAGRVLCRFRQAGERAYREEALERLKPSLYTFRFPQMENGAIVEYYFCLEGEQPAAWPYGGAEKPAASRIWNQAPPRLLAELTDYAAVRLSWPEWQASAALYEISRRGGEDADFVKLAVTPMNVYEDLDVQAGQRFAYRVQAVGAQGEQLDLLEDELAVGSLPLPGSPALRAEAAARGRVRLSWDSVGAGASAYQVYIGDTADGSMEPAADPIPVTGNGYQTFGWTGVFEPGRSLAFRVSAIGLDGREGEWSEPAVVQCANLPEEPLLTLDLDGSLDNPQGHQAGWLNFPHYGTGRSQSQAARFEGGNRIDFAKNPVFNKAAHEVTISAWIKPAKPDGGILHHGMPGFRGYLLQLRQGSLQFILSGVGQLEVQWEQTDGWRHVAAAYDGKAMRLYIDHQLAAEQEAFGCIAPFSGPMRIGMRFEGTIEKVRLWPVGLSGEDLRTRS